MCLIRWWTFLSHRSTVVCSQMMSASLTVSAVPTSFLRSHTCVIFFPRQAEESILPPSLRCSVLCSTCSLMSSRLCHHLLMSLSLLGFLPHPSPLPLWWYHYISILLCLEKYAFVVTFPFRGDSLLAHGTRWSVGGPAVLAALLLSLCLFEPFRLTSTLHLTHSD